LSAKDSFRQANRIGFRSYACEFAILIKVDKLRFNGWLLPVQDRHLILSGERSMYPFDISRPVIGKASIEINKPITFVFCFVGKHFFDNYPKWAVEVSEFKPLTGNEIFIGARAQQTRIEQGQKVESVFEVAEYEVLKKMTFVGVDAQFRNTYQFSARDEQDLTELEFSFELLELELFMRPFEKLIRMSIEEGAENTVENIKNLLVEDCK
jgi:hypothetical protein